jgi:CDP-paratose 2-epimerase
MFQRILITGGCGFVGSHLALNLKRDFPESEIISFDNLSRKGSELNVERLQSKGIQFIHGDVRYREQLEKVGVFDLLIDAAAEPSVLSGIYGSPDYVIETNLNGTLHCLHLAHMYKAALIFLSTSRVYPIENLNAIPYSEGSTRLHWTDEQYVNGISESFPVKGSRSFYGTSKLCSEHFIEEYISFYGLKAIVNRCGVIAGPWQMGKVDQGVIALWVARHFWKQHLQYIGFNGSGKQVRDVLHIDDLYALIKMQITHFDLFLGGTYNVGGGHEISTSLLELTAICEEVTGNKIEITGVLENRSADLPIYITDNSRIYEISGWKANKSVNTIVRDIFAWIKENETILKPLLG